MCGFSWKTFEVDEAFADVDVARARDNFEKLIVFEQMQVELLQPLGSRRRFALVFLVAQSDCEN